MLSFMHRPKFPRASTVLAVLVAGGLLLTVGCGNSNPPSSDTDEDPIAFQVGEPLEDTSYAVVVSSEYGSDTLSAVDYRRQVQLLLQRIPPSQLNDEQRANLHRNLVEQFATRHVLLGEARRMGIEADTAQVNMQMRQMRSQFESEEAFQQALAASNLTADSLRQMAAARIQMQMLQEQIAAEAEEPSDAEVEQYREDQQQEEVRARHILFRVDEGAPEDSVERMRERAQAVLDSARAGVDFAALARRHSEGPTASRGGDLGYFTKDRMVEPFAEAAFALPDSGSIADELVRTRFGFHIIQLTGRRMQEPMDTAQARNSLMNERRQEALEARLDELLAKATVRIHPEVVEADLSE
mgnify:CR=1 FL=1